MLKEAISGLSQLDDTSILAGLVASLVVVYFLRATSDRRRWKLPPGPMAVPWPMHYVIRLVTMWNRINPIQLLSQLIKRYGDIVYINEGGRRFVFLGSVDAVKEALIKQADITSGREEFWELQHCINYQGGIIFSEGEEWVEHRRFGLAALRNFGMGKKSLEHSINEEARMLRESLAVHVNKPLNPFSLVTKAVSNVICVITFGRRFEYEDPKFQEMVERISYFVAEDPDVMSDLPAFIMNARRKNLVEVRKYLKSEVREHRETLDPSNVRDVIDMYLREGDQARRAGNKTEIQEDKAWATVFDFFMAGTETTSNTILWLLLFMAGYPEIQERVVAEIKTVTGQDTAPNSEHRAFMPYTEATLMETLRFRPIAPGGVPHRSTADMKVRGYDIPEGVNIGVNILYIHHDPEIWGDPEVFRPDRFLSQDGKNFIKHEAFMPFGVGRRICLGEQLAKMELFLFFTNILQHFRVTFPPGAKPDYDIGHRFTTLEPKPYQIVLEER